MTPRERNVLWMEHQKPECLTCKHVLYNPPAMKCARLPIIGRGHLGKTSEYEYCIDAREGACGDGAALYEPNVGTVGRPKAVPHE